MAMKRKSTWKSRGRGKRRRYTSNRLQREFRNVRNVNPPRTLSIKSGDKKIVAMARTWYAATLTTAAGANKYGAYAFQLSDLPSYTDFTNPFDQYRIVGVKAEFIAVTPLDAEVTATGVSPTVAYPDYPVLITATDPDDASTPGSIAAVSIRESVKVHGPLNPQLVTKYVTYIKPKVAAELYQTGGFGGFGSMTNQWCDAAYPSVQHYGLKYCMASTSNTVPVNVQLWFTYMIELRYAD